MKKSRYPVLFFAFNFFYAFAGFSQQYPVVINEVMVSPVGNASVNSFYNGDSLSGGNPYIGEEWIELYNMDPCHSINISCFIIASRIDSVNGNWGTCKIPSGVSIPPLGHYVIGGNNVATADIKMGGYNSGNCSAKKWSLNDDAGWIGLYDMNGTPVDAVYWNIAGSPSDLNTRNEYFNNTTISSFLCSCCSAGFLVCAKDFPGISYGGHIIPNSSLTLSRKTDGSPDWITGPMGGTPKACNGGQDSCFSWDAKIITTPPKCPDGNDGTATVMAHSNGFPQSPYKYLWSNGKSDQTITNLKSGKYTVTITDRWGCKFVTDTFLNEPIYPVLNINSNSPVCEGSQLMLSSNMKGEAYSWLGSAGFTSNFDKPIVNNFQTINSGIYTLTIIDSNGCTLKASAIVEMAPVPIFNLGYDTTICDHQDFSYNVDNGNAFTYLWSDGSSYAVHNIFSANSNIIQNPLIAWVSITGCKTWIDSVIINIKHCDILIPNVFTPNNDNFNDIFYIKGLDKFPNSSLKIFNRWGVAVFESNNYQNNWNAENVSEGMYYYYLNVSNNTTDGMFYYGAVTIVKR